MFDVEQSIAEWRQRMVAGGVRSAEILDELENHLREDVEQEQQSGASTQRAFETAVRRMGDVDTLKGEFETAGGTGKTRARKPFDIFCVVFPALYLAGVSSVLWIVPGTSVREHIIGMVTAALTALTVFGWPQVYRIVPVISDWRLRMGIQVQCVISGAVGMVLAANFIFSHLNLPITQFLAVLWMVLAYAVLVALAAGLGEAAHQQNTPADETKGIA